MLDDALLFALALRRLPGVGRVTAGRLLARFPTLGALRATPREQVLVRLKGTAGASALVTTLADDAVMAPALDTARAEAAALDARRVRVHAPNLPGWPARLDALDRGDRPALLFTYGDAAVLDRPSAAFFGAPGLDVPAFEHAQNLLRAIAARGVVPVAGLSTGFDVVVHKVAAGLPCPSIAVAACGLGRISPPMRPGATATVRAGGLLVSPFEMEHGPFPHDDGERARTMVALAAVSLFFDPAPGSAEARALLSALALGRPTFGMGPRLPDSTPRLTGDPNADADAVAAAAGALR